MRVFLSGLRLLIEDALALTLFESLPMILALMVTSVVVTIQFSLIRFFHLLKVHGVNTLWIWATPQAIQSGSNLIPVPLAVVVVGILSTLLNS